MLRKIPVVLFLLILTSCGALSNLSKNFSEAREMIAELKPVVAKVIDASQDIYDQGVELVAVVKDTAAEMKAMEKASFKKADKDGDGNLDFGERIYYLLLLAAGGAEVVRRKMKATQAQFAQLGGRIEHERSKRKAKES